MHRETPRLGGVRVVLELPTHCCVARGESAALDLPLNENGKRRAAARAEWYSVVDQPLQVHAVID